MIQNVAQALAELREEVIFVGGACVSLYLDLEIAEEVRPTKDVDVLIEILSGGEYQKLSEKLLKMKFSPDQSIGAPLCRWKYLGMTIDIMSIDEKILGFSNKFYKIGLKRKTTYNLPDGQMINILPLDLFLATKLEAFFNRGASDPRFSSDLEDITAILLDSRDFEEVFETQNEIPYLKDSFNKIFSNSECIEAIRGFCLDGTFDRVKSRAMSL